MPFITDFLSVETQVSKIISIIATYRHRSLIISDHFAEYAPELQRQLINTVSRKEPIRFALSAFPFKEPAEGEKSRNLGLLPDKAEEFALQTLNGFANSIAEVYEGGARVVIITIASVYGDILSVSDADAFAYQTELRKLASSLGLKHLEFIPPGILADNINNAEYTLEEYSARGQETRSFLDSVFAQTPDIRENESRQEAGKYYDQAIPTTQDSEFLRTTMLKREKVYAKLVASLSQPYVPLSVQESDNVGKITLDLFPPSLNQDFLTPWRGAVAVLGDASVCVVDASTIDENKFTVVTNAQGRPWLIREKSDLFDWPGTILDFEPLYPCGMLVRPKQGHGPYKFEDVDMKRVRRLALSTAPLLLRGFTMEVSKEVYRAKAGELGEIQMWPFGDIIEIRENAAMNMNNVLTREAMPFHYDGVFKTVKDEQTGATISVPPLFQMFRNRAADQQIGGLTLFSSSRNMLPLLGPDTIPLDELRKLKWKTFTAANPSFGGSELILPFIAPHPETGAETFRYHEPWPASKCIGAATEPTLVEVPGMSAGEGEALCNKLTALMYDRRVVLRHQWEEGDFIFNDNATTHHTRTAFESGHRELWRVHVN